MKLVCFSILLVINIFVLKAQEAWLSTPESIKQFRNMVESMNPKNSQFSLSISDETIPLNGRNIDIRIYRPSANDLKPTLIYVHGACWVAGSLNSHDEICRYLSVMADVNVIAIDYRLAPEHKYPAAHNDVYDTIEWLWTNADELRIDTKYFAIAGESAGAYLAAATALRAKNTKNGPQFKFQLLVYAALDGGGSSWTPCKDLYFNNTDEVRTDYGSPLWSENLADLPTTFNIYGENEISRAEEELFIYKLKDQKVQAQSYMNKGVGHDVGNWLSVKAETPAHTKAIEFIKEGFKQE